MPPTDLKQPTTTTPRPTPTPSLRDPDAIVIGAGPNGLVAANVLSDAGWDVLVLEAEAEPGGAVRSGEITVPGFRHDLFSAFYPFSAISPPIIRLALESYGLRWCRAPLVLGHVFDDGRCAALSTDEEETASSVEGFGVGDGAAWRDLVAEWRRVQDPLVDALMSPFPPVWPATRLLAKLRTPHAVLDFVRFTLLPVRRLAAERFRGEGAAMLLAGNTLHTDLGPESAIGGFFAWLLVMLGQTVGFPVPEGGAAELTNALVRRLESKGGRVQCSQRVNAVLVRQGKAIGVRTAHGTEIVARRAVLADVAAPNLFLELVGPEHLPSDFLADLRRFEVDHGTVKVDWALSAPIPWSDADARRAGTLHVGGGMDHLTEFSAHLAMGRVPPRPFMLMGQMSRADPTRSPPGTETVWAYSHVPAATGSEAAAWDEPKTNSFVAGMEEEIERRAPGFGALVLGRHVFTPPDLERADANLIGGSVNGGTAQIHQQLVFRPTPGRAGAQTPVGNLYLASASAHPGGGVHGACGANAAAAALKADRRRRFVGMLSGRPGT
ncbi:MAG: phytoene desaturase family protein [Acidimicrobiales bacterium]